MQDKARLFHGVFPAHAGMSLLYRSPRQIAARFPRSRGDEPLDLEREGRIPLFSPLTRG